MRIGVNYQDPDVYKSGATKQNMLDLMMKEMSECPPVQ